MTDREFSLDQPVTAAHVVAGYVEAAGSTEEILLGELAKENQGQYPSYESLRSSLDRVLEHHVKDVPAQFDPVDVLVWGSHHGWLTFDGTKPVVHPPTPNV